jgi:DNA-binding GntR family transcriptional regulator
MSKVTDLAYERIRDRILSGEYPAGAHLKEEEIAHDTGASRTPVREALRRLNAEQLVTFLPNRGAYVSAWSEDDVNEIFVLRAILEGYAAYRAATRISVEQLASLETCADAIDTHLASADDVGRSAIGDANHRFHGIILEAANSERLTKLLSWLVETPLILRAFEHYTVDDIAHSNQHHREMIDALRAHNPIWAQKVMETHLHTAHNVYLGYASQSTHPEQNLASSTEIPPRE